MTTRPPLDDDPGVLERLEAGEPPASPEEAEARASCEHLFERLRDLEDISPPAGWEGRAAGRWRAARRRRQLGIALGATATAGLAALLLLRPCTGPTQARGPALELAMLDAPGPTRRGDHTVGSLLRARGRVDRAHVEVRLYLGTTLIAQCPGSPSCRIDASVVELTWTTTEPGEYQAVRLSSNEAIPPPSNGGIDRDQLDARNMGAITESKPVMISR